MLAGLDRTLHFGSTALGFGGRLQSQPSPGHRAADAVAVELRVLHAEVSITGVPGSPG